ncbi:MAG: hypothetical protein N2259_02205, partial [Patescibacteria group bacterium]|nr:hypothetical protein [Patescibacteria group bacterium]
KRVYVEVKRKRMPEEEHRIIYREKKFYIADVFPKEAEEGLKKIINGLIQTKIIPKFNSVGATDKNSRILILDYEEGQGTDLKFGREATLKEILGEEFFNKLENNYRITIWPRRYF